MVRANREVLLVIGGVFFFLPKLITAFFFGDAQMAMMAQLAQTGGMVDPQRSAAAVDAFLSRMLPVLVAIMLVEGVGYLAVIALLTDARRPTVGQALAMGARRLPTLIGVAALLLLGYLLAGMFAAPVVGMLIAARATAIAVIGGIAFVVMAGLMMTRLSLVFPVIVMDAVQGPWRSLRRAWNLTRGQAGRLFVFYLLLFIAYVVLALAIGIAVVTLVNLTLGQGSGGRFAANIVQGALGTAFSVVCTAVLVAVHRQLAQHSQSA